MIRISFNRRVLMFIGVLLFTVAWWYASLLEWRGEHVAKRVLAGDVSPQSAVEVPLSVESFRATAQGLLSSFDSDHDYIDELLGKSIKLRPLYAPYWFDRAKLAVRVGDFQTAEKYAKTAAQLWPTRSVLLWKIAMLYMEMGNINAALQTFKQHLRVHPSSLKKVLVVARRIEPEPGKLLSAILPANFPGREDVLWQVLRLAREQGDFPLGYESWNQLSAKTRGNQTVANYYVEWMMLAGNMDKAMDAWRDYKANQTLEPLENGGFESDSWGGLDWRIFDVKGARINRDEQIIYSDRYSLKVIFSGKENVHFKHLRQYLLVQPGKEYVLTFIWQGQNISTRSGPYISVNSLDGRSIKRSEQRIGSWDWQIERLGFTAPSDSKFVELYLRRSRTNALDNKLAGTLWLDDFSLQPLEPVEENNG